MCTVVFRLRGYPFCSIKRLAIFRLPLDGMLVHRKVNPSITFTGTHLYTWVDRGTVRVKCLAQEHITQCPWPELEPGPFDLETSALTVTTTTLPHNYIVLTDL